MKAGWVGILVGFILFTIADQNARKAGKVYYHLWLQQVGIVVTILILVITLVVIFKRRK